MRAVLTVLLIAAPTLWAIAALLALPARSFAVKRLSCVATAIGGVCALVAGGGIAANGWQLAGVLSANNVVGQLAVRAQPLSAVFIALLGLVALAGGLYAPRYHRQDPGVGVYLFCYNIAFIASLGVLVADNVTVFLVAWESMTLFSYFVILRRHRDGSVERASFLFLALGEVGFAMVVAAFVILATHTGTLDLARIAANSGQVASGWRDAAYVLALVGFGFKAGFVPLHIWLPEAHPAAPADGSALLSGLIIKLGIYGIALFGFYLLAPEFAWWGILTMLLGALTAVLGILYAMVERDLKRFLAFSSIENIGIILTALGGAMTFASYGLRGIAALLLLAALYHTFNHGTYKTLLFLEAGVIEHATGTRDMDRLGGLIRRLPSSSVIMLIGTLGIAALPPLNGFVSEWLIFQGLFQGFRIPSHLVAILIVVAGASVALTSGLAISAFARAYGISFLGMPRTREAAAATERDQPVIGPALLALATVALGLGATVVLGALDRVSTWVTAVNIHSRLVVPNFTVIPARTDFASISPTYMAVFLFAMGLVALAIYLSARPRAKSRIAPVWDGGLLSFKARMQYTATTYSNPIRVTFEELYRPEVHLERASDDPAGRSGHVHYHFMVMPIFERYLYRPVVTAIERIARFVRPIQSGDVNLYLLYIFIVILLVYVLYLL